MSESSVRKHARYTWSDYRTWDDGERWEIIGGEALLMSPSPTSRHQIISMRLAQMAPFFAGKTCHLLAAPMDVVLSEEDVVQPDLLVICDPGQIKRTHVAGAPTLVIEIVSDDSAVRDRRLKLDLYARSGVGEYWIVTPWPALIEVLRLRDGKYQVERAYAREDILSSPTFPDLRLELHGVFDFPLEPGEEAPLAKEPPGHAYRS